jgi:hypothetical protein
MEHVARNRVMLEVRTKPSSRVLGFAKEPGRSLFMNLKGNVCQPWIGVYESTRRTGTGRNHRGGLQ